MDGEKKRQERQRSVLAVVRSRNGGGCEKSCRVERRCFSPWSVGDRFLGSERCVNGERMSGYKRPKLVEGGWGQYADSRELGELKQPNDEGVKEAVLSWLW